MAPSEIHTITQWPVSLGTAYRWPPRAPPMCVLVSRLARRWLHAICTQRAGQGGSLTFVVTRAVTMGREDPIVYTYVVVDRAPQYTVQATAAPGHVFYYVHVGLVNFVRYWAQPQSWNESYRLKCCPISPKSIKFYKLFGNDVTFYALTKVGAKLRCCDSPIRSYRNGQTMSNMQIFHFSVVGLPFKLCNVPCKMILKQCVSNSELEGWGLSLSHLYTIKKQQYNYIHNN